MPRRTGRGCYSPPEAEHGGGGGVNRIGYERSGVCSLGEQTASKGSQARRGCEVPLSDVVAFELRVGATKRQMGDGTVGGTAGKAGNLSTGLGVRRHGEYLAPAQDGTAANRKQKCVGRPRVQVVSYP